MIGHYKIDMNCEVISAYTTEFVIQSNLYYPWYLGVLLLNFGLKPQIIEI